MFMTCKTETTEGYTNHQSIKESRSCMRL